MIWLCEAAKCLIVNRRDQLINQCVMQRYELEFCCEKIDSNASNDSEKNRKNIHLYGQSALYELWRRFILVNKDALP